MAGYVTVWAHTREEIAELIEALARRVQDGDTPSGMIEDNLWRLAEDVNSRRTAETVDEG